MIERWESEPLYNTDDKTRAVATLNFLALQNGWSLNEAENDVAHELAHAFVDDKPGILGFNNRGPITMYYRTIGVRTKEEIKKIALAPGDDISPVDQMVSDLTLSLPEFAKSQLQAIVRLFAGWIK